MMADCSACGAEISVDYEDDYTMLTCRCALCGARFTVEQDADYDGDHYVDCSAPGKRIERA